MALIGLAPILMNAALLKIGADNYEKVVGSAKLIPTTPIAKYKGISGATTVAAGTPSWQLQIEFAQDWTTASSLSQYLQTNAGTSKVIELTPQTGSQKATVTVIIVSGSVGGAADATTTDSVTLEVVGVPTFA